MQAIAHLLKQNHRHIGMYNANSSNIKDIEN